MDVTQSITGSFPDPDYSYEGCIYRIYIPCHSLKSAACPRRDGGDRHGVLFGYAQVCYPRAPLAL